MVAGRSAAASEQFLCLFSKFFMESDSPSSSLLRSETKFQQQTYTKPRSTFLKSRTNKRKKLPLSPICSFFLAFVRFVFVPPVRFVLVRSKAGSIWVSFSSFCYDLVRSGFLCCCCCLL